METHQILNGKVQLYRRGESRVWQCSASVGGKQRRATTKREGLAGNVQDYRIHRMTSRLEPNQGTIVHRPWFSPAEYKQLYEATRAYARDPFHERDRWNAEQVYDYVLFLANTGLRPDEAKARSKSTTARSMTIRSPMRPSISSQRCGVIEGVL